MAKANASNFIDTYFVLDLDRCICNTEKLHVILESVIEDDLLISANDLRRAKIETEGNGHSFDTISYIRKVLKDNKSNINWQDIQRGFITRAQNENVLNPFASELLTILDKNKIPHGIVTYGGEAWQLAKLEAANLLAIPRVITSIKEKGKLLSGWRQGDYFVIPPVLTRDFEPLIVSSIVFLDDKLISFRDMPLGVRGIHVLPFDHSPLLSSGDLPKSVSSVVGIKGAIDLLF
jgi:hypothetical protein